MEKSFYYRTGESGEVEKLGPFPSNGDWPSKYAARGMFLTPHGVAPDDQPNEDLVALAAAAGLETEGMTRQSLVEVIAAALSGGDAPEGEEPPDFEKKNLDELKALAAEVSIDVGSMKKQEVIEALTVARAEASRVVAVLGFAEPAEGSVPA